MSGCRGMMRRMGLTKTHGIVHDVVGARHRAEHTLDCSLVLISIILKNAPGLNAPMDSLADSGTSLNPKWVFTSGASCAEKAGEEGLAAEAEGEARGSRGFGEAEWEMRDVERAARGWDRESARAAPRVRRSEFMAESCWDGGEGRKTSRGHGSSRRRLSSDQHDGRSIQR
jgi:hypothetical protein